MPPTSQRSRRANARGQRASLRLEGRDRLVFGKQVHHQDATRFRRLMHEAQQRGDTGFTFDFSRTEFAAPVAMAQLVVQAEACRRRAMHFDVLDPKDKRTRRVFMHSNWAHHLSPVNYAPNENQPKGWLPVVRYRNDEELYRLVNHSCGVVLSEARIRRSALHGLEWALNEMADNVIQHAEAPEGGLVALTVAAQRRRVQFVVADAGRGIPTSMRTGHSNLRTDLHAVRHALRQGVTRDRRVGAGNGLAGALRIATAAGGSFLVHSGRAFLHASAARHKPVGHMTSATAALDGTVVYFEIGVDREFDLEGALLRDGITIADWDYFDAAYEPDAEDVSLMVRDETTSTATRVAAKPLRIKARNLVDALKGTRVVLDFDGVDRITASFADEVVGKLLVSLGPDAFAQRIVLHNLGEGLLRGQIMRAVAQRRDEARRAQARRARRAARQKRRAAGDRRGGRQPAT